MSCTTHCYYCGSILATRHEHDHWPVPVRHGGESTVCACINCHDLLDRQPLDRWPEGVFHRGFRNMDDLPIEARLLMAKVLKISMDREVDRRTSEVAA